MAEAIRMPLLSDTMTEGVIAEWHKQVGDEVKGDDVIADVETDKATMEVTPYVDGTLLYIAADKGQGVPVNGIMAIVGSPGEDFQSILDKEKTNSTTAPAKKPAEAAVEPAKPEPAKPEVAAAPAKSEVAEVPAEPSEAVKENETPAVAANEKATPAAAGAGPDPGNATVVRMPLLSDTMTEGKIVAWHKKVGDTVKSDDVIADVETDKAIMEVMPYADGTLLYVGVKEGEAAKINDIIAIVGKAGTDVSSLLDGSKTVANAAPSTTPVAAKAAGETTAAIPVTEKAAGNVPSTQSAATTPAHVPTHEENDERLKASPLARKLASDKGIDIHQLTGTGDNGRIIKRDIDSFQPPKVAPQVAKTVAAAQSMERPAPVAQSTKPAPQKTVTMAPVPLSAPGQESHTDIPLSQMRRIIAQKLSESKFSAPHFYLTMTITMDNAMEARKAINSVSPVKVSFNDLVIKACAMALRQHQWVNSSWMGEFVRQNHHINIGTAVAVDEGLIVPVIKFADQKSLSQIATEAATLIEKARTKKIQPQEFTGNTFTISNLGMMDIDEFTAIINPPDSCILAVGKITPTPVVENNQVVVRQLMKITLSCDHRVVDGAVGSRFLQTLKTHLENPVTMLV